MKQNHYGKCCFYCSWSITFKQYKEVDPLIGPTLCTLVSIEIKYLLDLDWVPCEVKLAVVLRYVKAKESVDFEVNSTFLYLETVCLVNLHGNFFHQSCIDI